MRLPSDADREVFLCKKVALVVRCQLSPPGVIWNSWKRLLVRARTNLSFPVRSPEMKSCLANEPPWTLFWRTHAGHYCLSAFKMTPLISLAGCVICLGLHLAFERLLMIWMSSHAKPGENNCLRLLDMKFKDIPLVLSYQGFAPRGKSRRLNHA